jgi:hypothetical protein
MTTRLPYHAPALESLGSIEGLTQTSNLPQQSTDGAGYGPGTAPPGS